MKPIKCILTLAVLIILVGEAVAQGSYLNAGFGYGFSAGDWLGVTEPDGTEKNVYGSFGKGLTLGLNTGYMVNDNTGFDLGLWYVMGSTYQFISDFGSSGNSTHKVSGNTFRVMPAIKVTSGRKDNKPYAKFGFILGVATKLNDDETFTSPFGITDISHEFTACTSHGWTGAFGIDFSGNQSTSFFLEANFCHQVFKPSLETLNIAGLDPQKFKLVDEPNASDPDEKLRPFFSFSTITVTAGIKFSAAAKKKNAATQENK